MLISTTRLIPNKDTTETEDKRAEMKFEWNIKGSVDNGTQTSQDERWREAMQQEIKALEKNKTWTLEELPEGKRAIDSKWVYKIKYKSNGEVERYKARLVAKGFTQMEGVDYHETFAPVAKLVTVRTLLAVATKKDWIIHQLDVNNAFLHGDLEEEVYMKIPQGFLKEGETRVCRLRKSLYGLKQASRNWYHKFTSFLLTLNFKQSKADYSLFTYQKEEIYVAILIYVDDVIIVGNNTKKIHQIKKQLDDEFSIKDLGQLKYFLGIEVAKTSDGLVISQRKYTLDILKDSGMVGCRPSAFPFEQGTKLDKGEKEARVDATQYRRLVGRLLYLQATRPDITYAVNVVSQFVADPRQNHSEAAKRVLRYLKGTPGQGILLPRDGPSNLTAYCDSDWLGCPFTRRSRTGYLLILGGGPISWRTKKQSVVSRSSAEAEYRAMASTVGEILWVRWLLKDLQVDITTPTPLFCDNQAARHIANNPAYHERTKHVEMDCFFVRERVETKEIQPKAIDSKH
ncbi:putative RNA-directed DNA polymerase [Tanacetum coccineum]